MVVKPVVLPPRMTFFSLALLAVRRHVVPFLKPATRDPRPSLPHDVDAEPPTVWTPNGLHHTSRTSRIAFMLANR